MYMANRRTVSRTQHQRDLVFSTCRCIRNSNSSLARSAFTLVELLVTIAIIGALVALLLPGIQSARESGRRAQCANNLRNIGLGLLAYHNSHNSFPYGGWGYQWVGVPDRGHGPHQPGGWIYSTLPFVEELDLYKLGLGLSGTAADKAYSRRLQAPISLFVCPSRRSCSAWPVANQYLYMRSPRPFGQVEVVARADYAINAGTSHVINLGGPIDLLQGDDAKYWANAPNPIKFNGVSHLRVGATLKSVLDGASKTYMIGEKHVPVNAYETGTSPGDNESLYSGYCTDLHRFAGALESIKANLSPLIAPLSDTAIPDNSMPDYVRFGSAHASGLNMSYCDGSVRLVGYDIDPEIHLRSGHRSDEGRSLDALR